MTGFRGADCGSPRKFDFYADFYRPLMFRRFARSIFEHRKAKLTKSAGGVRGVGAERLPESCFASAISAAARRKGGFLLFLLVLDDLLRVFSSLVVICYSSTVDQGFAGRFCLGQKRWITRRGRGMGKLSVQKTVISNEIECYLCCGRFLKH